jgi:hypothetical protein
MQEGIVRKEIWKYAGRSKQTPIVEYLKKKSLIRRLLNSG